MQIIWVNHASFIVRQGNTQLICDPWLEGYAFDRGWALLSPTRLEYSAFGSVNYIWFSHEHPDHFSPQVLKKIPLEFRKRITVLFQRTPDRKIINFCLELQFERAIEMEPLKKMDLGDGLRVMNEPWTDGDSWLFIEGDKKVLNVNDCIIPDEETARRILGKTGGKPDVLLTQFSYANWTGNREDKTAREKHASEKLSRLLMQVEVFRPAFTVPFASFVWFCHEDNKYLNDSINKVDAVADAITRQGVSSPVVLYPGDIWTAGDKIDNKTALAAYTADYDSIPSRDTVKAVPVDFQVLSEHGNAFARQLCTFNNRWMIKSIPPAHIFIDDLKIAAVFSASGLKRVNLGRPECDISINSDALDYCFRFLWGGDSININGRYQVPGGFYPRADRFWHYFFIARLNNRGKKEPLNLRMMALALFRRLRGK